MSEPDRTASLMTPAKLAQTAPRAPASPGAWLTQMAADAGHQHVARLAELCSELEGQARARDFRPVSGALQKLADALPQLDFSLLQARGWWARTTGKSKSAGAEFAAQFEQLDDLVTQLAAQTQAMQKAQQEQASPGERTLVEAEVEYRAIEKIIDQGARWLQDMRNQLKARHATAADEQSQQAIKDDAARCEILVARLKTLRAVSSAAQQAHEQAQAAAGRRAALAQLLQQAVTANAKGWRNRLSTLASVAGDDSAPALNMEGPMESHRELQLGIKQAIADCGQLQAQEKLLGEGIEALRAQLAGAR